MFAKEYTSKAAAQSAINAVIRSGRASGGYVGEKFNHGTMVFTAHLRSGSTSWAICAA